MESAEVPTAKAMTLMSDDKGNSIQVDYLTAMFAKQLAHKQQYDVIYRAKGLDPVAPGGWGNLNDPRVQAELRTTAVYMMEELFEGINLLKNKPWKQTPRETDHELFYKEMADFWHFLLEFMIIAGMTPERIVKYYFMEAKKNDERRESGY